MLFAIQCVHSFVQYLTFRGFIRGSQPNPKLRRLVNMAATMKSLAARHIQNMSEAASLEPHWGYANRAVPCTNDKGSCEYLDVVYHSHDLGIWYAGIFWATVGGILFLWGIGRRLYPSPRADQCLPEASGEQAQAAPGTIQRFKNSVSSYRRQFFLPKHFDRYLEGQPDFRL